MKRASRQNAVCAHTAYTDVPNLSHKPLAGSIFSIRYHIVEVPISEQVTIELLKGFLEDFNRHECQPLGVEKMYPGK